VAPAPLYNCFEIPPTKGIARGLVPTYNVFVMRNASSSYPRGLRVFYVFVLAMPHSLAGTLGMRIGGPCEGWAGARELVR